MTPTRKLVPSLIAIALASAGTAARADDYRGEVTVTADRVNPDADAPNVDTFSALGTYYFAPVRTDGLPLAEAAFLGRAGYVDAGVGRIDFGRQDRNVPNAGAGFADRDVDFYAADIGYYVPDTIFFGRLGVARADFDGDSDTKLNGTFGITPLAGLLITTDADEDGWDPNVSAKYVGKMANSHYYAITASAVDPDEGDTDVGLGFDYYLDTTFSVGAAYGSAADTFQLRAQKFFSPRFAVGGHVLTSDDGDGFGASVTWRF